MSAPQIATVRAQQPHPLSPSQASTFLDCSYRWYCSHALKLADPANGGLALGRAVHDTAAAILRQVAAGGELPDAAHAAAHFREKLAIELQTAELAPDEDREQLADRGAAMIALWLAQAAPEIQPAAVEVELRGLIAGIEVHAIADVITTDGLVVDLKTASKRPGGISADHALQLTTYAMLTDHSQARLVTVTKTQAPAIVQHTLEITPQARRYAEAIYPAVSEAMQTGLYLPRRSSNLCSRKHCAFWRRCESEFGGEVRS